DTPPPPKLQIREPQINTQAPPPPVTLPIEPTKKEDRVEYTGPPVIVPGPPPPPAPPAPPKPSVITNPSWSRQVQPEFPERANSRGIESGSAKVNCAVAANGSLSDCRIVDEDPAGAGFGQAVLRAARSGRLAPRTVDGAAVGARVEFTTRFRLD
ncbi:energy transducer TonB, partial [Brevundimonas sp. MYb31]|uniref:energy transducer TonB n=2 Tax=unclassified Brevundimonas TaxID=2622653 RepID=UPI0011B0A762